MRLSCVVKSLTAFFLAITLSGCPFLGPPETTEHHTTVVVETTPPPIPVVIKTPELEINCVGDLEIQYRNLLKSTCIYAGDASWQGTGPNLRMVPDNKSMLKGIHAFGLKMPAPSTSGSNAAPELRVKLATGISAFLGELANDPYAHAPILTWPIFREGKDVANQQMFFIFRLEPNREGPPDPPLMII